MRIALIALLLAGLSSPACADTFWEVIQYRCDRAGNAVQVQMLGAYGDAGEALARGKDENSFNPWDLVNDGGTGRHIRSTRTIRKSCVLSDGTYVVELGPSPCNHDTQGQDGAMMMAWAKIARDGKVLAQARFGTCGAGAATVTTKLLVRPGQKPFIETKSVDDYFGADDELVSCLKSVGENAPIRLQFTLRRPDGKVRYERGSGAIQLKLSRSEVVNSTPGRLPAVWQMEWEEVGANGGGGRYVGVLEGDAILEFKYLRKDGKTFRFENDADSSTGKGCRWIR